MDYFLGSKFHGCMLLLISGVMAAKLAVAADVLPAVQVRADAEADAQLLENPDSANWRLDHTDLMASHRDNLNEVAYGIPGTRISLNGTGSAGIIMSRGARSGVGQVVLDGIPLFSTLIGTFPLGRYPMDNFDQVEFFDAFSGRNRISRSLSGSIQLTSRHLADGHGFLHSEGGSYGTLRNQIAYGLRTELSHISLIAGRSDIFEGISQALPTTGTGERDKFGMSNLQLRLDNNFGKATVESSLYYVNSYEHMDGPGVLQYSPRGLPQAVGWQDQRNGYLFGETWVAQSKASYEFNDHYLSQLRLGFTQNKDRGIAGNIVTRLGTQNRSMTMDSQLYVLNWENQHLIYTDKAQRSLRLDWGLDTQAQIGESPYTTGENAQLIGHPTHRTNTVISPFARLSGNYQHWFANAELRSDHYNRYSDPNLLSMTLGYAFNSQLKTWLSAGNGFRQPSVNELLHPLYGLMTLKPERQRSTEFGIEWRRDRETFLSAKGFYQSYENLITAAQADRYSLFKASNIAEANVAGMEFDSGYAWNANLSSGLTYTYNEMTDAHTHQMVPGRPRHYGKYWTRWTMAEPLRFYHEINFRSDQWADISNQINLAAVPRVSARLEYDVNRHFTAYVRGENLNNDKTQEVYRIQPAGLSIYGGFMLRF